MRAITYSFQSGDDVEVAEVQVPSVGCPEFPTCAVFAFAKAGSVLVNAIVRDLMAEAGVAVIDWPELWYRNGIDMAAVQGDLARVFPQFGYCLAGFREFPRAFVGAPALRRLRKLLVVRDPRDMLVSRYFSTRYSHGFEERGTPQFAHLMRGFIADGGMDIDSFCLFYSWIVNGDLFAYRDIIGDPATLVLKYEDFIYDKRHLVTAIRDWFGLEISPDACDKFAARHDAIPDVERVDRHLRQARPGDHRRKLKRETITALNAVLGEFMTTFGYQP